MCFSATASFGAGTVLLGIGVLTWRSAQQPAEWPFAAIPLLFALQQFIEGSIWLSFGGGWASLNAWMTDAYGFFSHVLWPVFVPLAVLLIEPRGARRHAQAVLLAAGVVAGGGLLWSIAAGGIASRPAGHHIEYIVPHGYSEMTMTLYLLSTGVSMLMSSHRTVRLFGLLALLSFGVAYAVYTTWFVSVWCYFAALLSTVVLFHFHAKSRSLKLAPT